MYINAPTKHFQFENSVSRCIISVNEQYFYWHMSLQCELTLLIMFY